jgi:hypothetical protein
MQCGELVAQARHQMRMHGNNGIIGQRLSPASPRDDVFQNPQYRGLVAIQNFSIACLPDHSVPDI